MLRERAKVINRLLAIMDVFLAILAFNLALWLDNGHLALMQNKDTIILHFVLIAVWYILGTSLHLNQLFRSRPYSVVLFKCLSQVLFGTALLALSIWLFQLSSINLKILGWFAGITLLLSFSAKMGSYFFMKRARSKGLNFLNVLVIGDESARPFLRQIMELKEWGYRIVAIMGTPELEKEFGTVAPFLPPDTNVEELLRNQTIDELIYYKEDSNLKEIESLMHTTSEVGVVFRMYSSFFNILNNKTRLHYFGTTPMLTISTTPMNYLEMRGKDLFDRLFSATVVVVFAPVFVLIALAIKVNSSGPVFFKQKRVGVRGRKFFLFKFRTMVVNAEALKHQLEAQNEMDGPVFKMTNDPRVTKIGHFLRKTSLDELPQFFNVLMGDMSVVGPRPPLPQEVGQYESWQFRRLSMKPGITCLWQVSGRNNIAFDDWMKMDLQYIDNWSLKLDFVIFLKTIRTVVRGDGK